jgi:hypothetical protein
MPDLNGRELLSEWRRAMDSVIGSAASAAGRSPVPGEMLKATRRQLDLLQALVETEQRMQGSIIGGLLTPFETFFDLLEETGSTLRRQAEALESAGRALQESAALLRTQAELFERGIRTLRQPTDLAKAAATGKRRSATARAPAQPAGEASPPPAARAPRQTASRRQSAPRAAGPSKPRATGSRAGGSKPRSSARKPSAGTAKRPAGSAPAEPLS